MKAWPFLLGGLLVGVSAGQSISGAIEGVVKDSSNAALPDTLLTLTNLDENTSTQEKSSALGLYQFLNLPPGRYQVVARHEGFAGARTVEILLGARETRRSDLTLPVAPRAESVEVVAEVPLINTANGTISDSKNFEAVTRLPVNSRVYNGGSLSAILSVPGTQLDILGRISLSGGLPAQVDYSVDGISIVDISLNGPIKELSPSPEMINEFRATSVGAGAASGQMGDVTLVSRGGTSEYHGSIFWYHQNRALDAKIWGAVTKQQKVFHSFGGSLGGPVVIPGLYDGHNRTFFFADYEGSRRPYSAPARYSVPTASMRAGFLDGVPGPAAVDPTTAAPFPGNRIPVTSINPVARRLLDGYYPLPNVDSSSTVNNLQVPFPRDSYTDGYDLRIDQVLNATQRVFVRWSTNWSDLLNGFGGINPAAPGNTRFQALTASHIWALNGAMSNELRFGISLATGRYDFPIKGREAVADLGLRGLNLANAGDQGGFPYFYFGDATGFTYIGTGRPPNTSSSTFQYSDVFSWVRGQHTVKLGADVRRVGYKTTLHQGGGSDEFGGFEFYSNTFSGSAYADLLLGMPAVSYYAFVGPNVDQFATHAGFFAQDSWRVHPRLTLEIGLRWEVHPALKERSGNITNFDHSTGDVIIPDHSLAPSATFLKSINACVPPEQTACTRVLTASQAGLPQGLRKTDYRDWGPRFGFAWQPRGDGRTVVRGSFGLYTQTMLGQVAYAMTGVHTSDARVYSNKGPDGNPQFLLPDVLPAGGLAQQGTQDFVNGADPALRDPHSSQWSLTIERQTPWDAVVRVSYVGVHSAGMPVLVDFNQLPPSQQPYDPARRPFPQWARLYSVENVGFSSYQGLQTEVSRRLRNGFYFQASYVFSKNVGSIASPGRPFLPPELYQGLTVSDRFNTRYDRGNLYGSRRHRLLLTGLFPLPFGKGRSHGNNWNALLDGVLGGWELSTVTLFQSGPFQTPAISPAFDRSNTNVQFRGVQARPDRFGDGNLENPTADQYYDRSAFGPAPAGAGRMGNAGAGILEGPGQATAAVGLAKTFRLSETARLRLESTFTNVTNHPNFAPPNVNVSQPSFGKLTSVQAAENSGNRTGQIGVRIDF